MSYAFVRVAVRIGGYDTQLPGSPVHLREPFAATRRR